MKKIISIILVLFISSTKINAQIDPKTAKKAVGNNNHTTTVNAVSGTIVSDFQVSELSNFAGRKENPRLQNGKLTASFPLKNVSIIIPRGKIIYLKYCNSEFPVEQVYSTSQANINLEDVCAVRSDESAGFSVFFNGISTGIHDNDCKKVFGSIIIKLTEVAPDGTEVNFKPNTGSAFRGSDAYTFQPLRIASADAPKNIANYVFNDDRVQNLSRNIISSSSTGEDMAGYVVGKNALRQGRVKIYVTTNLAGAHKMNSLADYSSNIHMDKAITESFPFNITFPYLAGSNLINATNNSIVLGPYSAHGDPDHSTVASGGYWFTQNFRVHLSFTFPSGM